MTLGIELPRPAPTGRGETGTAGDDATVLESRGWSSPSTPCVAKVAALASLAGLAAPLLPSAPRYRPPAAFPAASAAAAAAFEAGALEAPGSEAMAALARVSDAPRIGRERLVLTDTEPAYRAFLERRFRNAPGTSVAPLPLPAVPDSLHAERFDTVVCLNVLEHVRDDMLSLSAMFRLLEPGGRLVAWRPCRNGARAPQLIPPAPSASFPIPASNRTIRPSSSSRVPTAARRWTSASASSSAGAATSCPARITTDLTLITPA